MSEATVAVLRDVEKQLMRIADCLEMLVAPPLTPEPEPQVGCPHPEESQVSFGMIDGVETWECTKCRQRYSV